MCDVHTTRRNIPRFLGNTRADSLHFGSMDQYYHREDRRGTLDELDILTFRTNQPLVVRYQQQFQVIYESNASVCLYPREPLHGVVDCVAPNDDAVRATYQIIESIAKLRD